MSASPSEIKERIEAIAGEVMFGMRSDGHYYVRTARLVELGGDGFLCSPTESGATPARALEQWWYNHVDNVSDGRYLEVKDPEGVRRRYVWATGVWHEVVK